MRNTAELLCAFIQISMCGQGVLRLPKADSLLLPLFGALLPDGEVL
jgi:hypothetical protein